MNAALEGIRAEFEERLEEFSARIGEETKRTVGEGISEWQRVSALTDEEKLDEREKDIARREAELVHRELRAEAAAELAKNGLPAELAAGMNFDDAGECGAAVKALAECFRNAVTAEVEKRLSGRMPEKGAPAPDPMEMTDEQYYCFAAENLI